MSRTILKYVVGGIGGLTVVAMILYAFGRSSESNPKPSEIYKSASEKQNEALLKSIQKFSKALKTGVNRSEFNQYAVEVGLRFDEFRSKNTDSSLVMASGIKKDMDFIEVNIRYANRLSDESPMGWNSDGVTSYLQMIVIELDSIASSLSIEDFR